MSRQKEIELEFYAKHKRSAMPSKAEANRRNWEKRKAAKKQ